MALQATAFKDRLEVLLVHAAEALLQGAKADPLAWHVTVRPNPWLAAAVAFMVT